MLAALIRAAPGREAMTAAQLATAAGVDEDYIPYAVVDLARELEELPDSPARIIEHDGGYQLVTTAGAGGLLDVSGGYSAGTAAPPDSTSGHPDGAAPHGRQIAYNGFPPAGEGPAS